MKNKEYTFDTEITLLGVDRPATCHYCITSTGAVCPFSVRVGDNIYPADNWAKQLKDEAIAHYNKQKQVAV